MKPQRGKLHNQKGNIMFKEEIFTLWEDDIKAIDMADHATPPAHLEGDWDEWEWNDWEIFDGENPKHGLKSMLMGT